MSMLGIRRRRTLGKVVGALAVAGVAVGVAAYALRAGTVTPGPLQPTGNVESFGTYANDGSTLSLIVELRAEVPVVATLDAVSLASPDPGLALVGSGILSGPFTGYIVKSYPPGSMSPVAGARITGKPGDPSGDVFIVLGIKADLARERRSAHGVWLDDQVDGVRHRALLPWLLNVCPEPGTDPCPNQPPESITLPAPDG